MIHALGLVLVLASLAGAPEDRIRLRGVDRDCSGCVVKSEKEALVIRIARAEIETSERAGSGPFPDRVTFRDAKRPIEALVLEEDAASLTIRVPASAVERIERERPKKGEATETPPAPAESAAAPGSAGSEAKSPGPEPARADTGEIAGRVVRAGKPLESCRVRALRLVEEPDFLGLTSRLRPVKDAVPPESITDGDGRFRIGALVPGIYKLYLCPVGEGNWIRRLREAPDAEVRAGLSVRIKDVDLSRKPL